MPCLVAAPPARALQSLRPLARRRAPARRAPAIPCSPPLQSLAVAPARIPRAPRALAALCNSLQSRSATRCRPFRPAAPDPAQKAPLGAAPAPKLKCGTPHARRPPSPRAPDALHKAVLLGQVGYGPEATRIQNAPGPCPVRLASSGWRRRTPRGPRTGGAWATTSATPSTASSGRTERRASAWLPRARAGDGLRSLAHPSALLGARAARIRCVLRDRRPPGWLATTLGPPPDPETTEGSIGVGGLRPLTAKQKTMSAPVTR